MRNNIYNLGISFTSFRLILIIFTILLLINSCDILNSEDENGDPGGNGTIPIGIQVIGPSGGEINLDSIIVKVPANAFNEDNEITVSAQDGAVEFGENVNSALYQIDGFPSTINKPIKLSIKYNGTIEGDTLVAVGEMLHSTTLDSTVSSFHTENASDSAGYLVYDLPIHSSLGKLTRPQIDFLDELKIIVLSSYVSLPSSNGHFKLSFPLSYYQQGVLMGEHFETAYDKCLSMGFSYPVRKWPVDVIAKPEVNFNGQYSYKISSPNGKNTVTDEELRSFINIGTFTINLNILSDDLKLRTVCGHEFLHLVQNLYEFSAPTIEPEQKWLKEATSTWIMEKFANTPNYVPHSITNRELYPFGGWQYSAPGYKHSEIGYGLAVLIKDIADTYGDDAIVKIFEKIISGTLPGDATDPIDAVLSVIDEPIDFFWHRVLGLYLLGYYYNDQVNFRYLDNPDKYTQWNETVYWETVTIDTTETNSHHTIRKSYHDLSGKLFKVKPGNFGTKKEAPILLTVSDPINCGIMVSKYKKGSEISHVAEVFPGGSGNILLDDVKPIFDDGYELIVLVSNSTHDKNSNYKGTKNIELDIELLIEPDKPPIEEIWVYFMVTNADQKFTHDGTVYRDTLDFVNGFFDTQKGSSTFKNGVYSTVWNNVPSGADHLVNGDMTVTFTDILSSIDLHLNYTYSKISDGKAETTTLDFQGLPLLSSEYSIGTYGYLEEKYAVSSSDVCGLSYSFTNNDPANNGITEILGFECGADAEVTVTVSHEWVDE